MRLPLPTDLKTRTGVPTGKDARQGNSYVEIADKSAKSRKRPAVRGGVAVCSGTAQGGIGLGGVLYKLCGDVLGAYSGGGTTWSSVTPYSVGDHVSVGFVDYWALADNTNSMPPGSNWSTSYVAAVVGASSWTTGTTPVAAGTFVNHGIAHNGSVYAYLTTDIATGEFYSITSGNGLVWETHPITGLILQSNHNIIYGNGVFLCAGAVDGFTGETATSVDGVNWTYHTNTLLGSFYDFGFNGSLFCGILDDGTIYTSPDGFTWTVRGAMASSLEYAITSNGSAFVITSYGTECAYSADGLSWGLSSMPSSSQWWSVVSDGTVFCAVDTTGKYAISSDDGATWSEGLTGLDAASYISYGNGIFLCTKGNTNGIDYATSANGSDWTIRQFPDLGVTGQWTSSIYGSKFVVLSRSTYCATSLTGL